MHFMILVYRILQMVYVPTQKDGCVMTSIVVGLVSLSIPVKPAQWDTHITLRDTRSLLYSHHRPIVMTGVIHHYTLVQHQRILVVQQSHVNNRLHISP